MCKNPGLTSDVSKLAFLLLFLTGRWQCQSVVSSCVREPQRDTQPLPRPGGPARQTSAQPGRAGASMDDDPACPGLPWERRRCGTFCFCYDPHSEGTYPDFLPSGTPSFQRMRLSLKEGRMKFTVATKFNRKSGGPVVSLPVLTHPLKAHTLQRRQPCCF
jgi:hypothetical protein